jgi:hypothetical protein
MRRRAVVAVAALVVGLSAPPAYASGQAPVDEARVELDAAERAARELDFATALAAYERALELAPSASFAPKARARAADLRAHAEGAFAPLRALERVRRDPRLAADRAVVDGLARDADRFPDGRVRAEARLLAAGAYRHTFGDPGAAVAPLGAVLADGSADRLTRVLALDELVAIHRSMGALGAAREAVDRYPTLSPPLHAEIHRLVRRERLRWVSALWLGALALIGVASAARLGWRLGLRALPAAVVRPLAVAYALYVGAGAAVVARLYGTDDPRPFLLLGVGVLALDVLARAWRQAAVVQGPWARLARAFVCGAGVLALAFLALERTEAGYLESFGL